MEAVESENLAAMPLEMVPDELSEADSDNEDLEKSLLQTVKQEKQKSSFNNMEEEEGTEEDSKEIPQQRTDSEEGAKPSRSSPTITPVDDYIRNFLIKHGMQKTLDVFQTEWYEKAQQGSQLKGTFDAIPEVYTRLQAMEEEILHLKSLNSKSQQATNEARGTWDKFRKERDFHRMHHRRVVQEKNKLIADMKRLKNYYSKYEPALQQTRKKYEDTAKEKMLVIIERDRLKNRLAAYERETGNADDNKLFESRKHSPKAAATAASATVPSTAEETKSSKNLANTATNKSPKDSILPLETFNAALDEEVATTELELFHLVKTYEAHTHAISCIDLHPKKPAVATASDDRSWKLWSIPNGDRIMTGEGHKDWISGIKFSPDGSFIVTASGDKTVKVWDLEKACCSHTFTDHTMGVWDVDVHFTGNFIASGSMDHTVRLWDLSSLRCRQTFRGHVDSVNSVCFQPFSNNLLSASGDKTLSMWDTRSGLCIQTFFGHGNAVNHATFNAQGDTILSSDADGEVKVWDIRMLGEICSITTNPNSRISVSEAHFDRSGSRVVAASEDGTLKLYDKEGKSLGVLQGHTSSVLAAQVDVAGQFMISASADHTFRLWSR